MAELQIKPGTKLKAAFDTAVGQQTDFNMMATFKGAIDEAYFLISAPMLAGKPLILDENQKLLFQYTEGGNTFMLAGYPESVEKAGIRTLWKMRRWRASHVLEAPRRALQGIHAPSLPARRGP